MQVISIGGASRSGSTLLALLLGQNEGCFAVGELRYAWSRGYAENWLCGCGTPFRECGFWQSVFEEAYGGFDRVPLEEIKSLHASVAGISRLPQLLLPVKRSRFEKQLAAYVDHLQRLCRAISVVTNTNTIIDSSKLPSYCYLLSLLPGVDYEGIQLVRDSRAVAFSFLKKVRRPDVPWREDYMARFSPAKSALDWNALNLAMELVRTKLHSSAVLRYEDLVRNPREELGRVAPSLFGRIAKLSMDGGMTLAMNHTVSGNPIRMAGGRLEIREDTEWRRRMRGIDRYFVSALTWPLLRRYGYVGPARREVLAEGIQHRDEAIGRR